jgi:hypothetical protein
VSVERNFILQQGLDEPPRGCASFVGRTMPWAIHADVRAERSGRVRSLVLLAALAGAGLAAPVAAGEPEGAATLGEWRGPSLCTDRVRAPACKDEEVLYHFTPVAGGPEGKVHLKADKLVDGKFETMGELDFEYDSATKEWKSEFRSPRFHGLWTYAVDGRRLSGTLIDLPSKALIRRISCARK